METMIWVAVIVIAAILEGMSAQLISIWFVGGGIAGMIAQLCGAPVWLQVLIAAVVTLVLLLATRPLVKKFLQNKETHTNADRVVGQTAVGVALRVADARQGGVTVGMAEKMQASCVPSRRRTLYVVAFIILRDLTRFFNSFCRF